MAYQIRYGKCRHDKVSKSKKMQTWLPLICVCLLAFGILWLNRERVLRRILPGDPEITVLALENLEKGLASGENLLDAVTAFGKEIVNGADLEP